jgi:hypothetical protein
MMELVPRFSWTILSSNFSTNLGGKATADAKVDFEAARETGKIERNTV